VLAPHPASAPTPTPTPAPAPITSATTAIPIIPATIIRTAAAGFLTRAARMPS
jgi:hypothetical protein